MSRFRWLLGGVLLSVLVSQPVVAEFRSSLICTPLEDPSIIPIENPFELYAIGTEAPELERRNFRPRLGSYRYRVSWQGIGAANIHVDVNQVGLEYIIHVRVTTSDVIRMFYRLQYEATSHLSATDFLPTRTEYHQRENSRERVTQVVYHNDGAVESRFWARNREPYSTLFAPRSPVLDPFSAAFIARGLEWWEGRSVTFDTFNGRTRYLITLTAEERRNVRINGQVQDVWVVVPSVRKSDESQPHSKLDSARIYVTADEHQEVLKLESQVFVGTVETTLRSFTPAPVLPDGVRFASKKPKGSRL